MKLLILILVIAAALFFLLAGFQVGKERRISFEWLACAAIVAAGILWKA
jgi:hypothetical protein